MRLQNNIQGSDLIASNVAEEREYLTIGDVVRFVLRNLWLIALCAITFGSLAFYYAQTTTELFTARATILIDREQTQIAAVNNNTIAVAAAPVDDDIQVILSDEVLLPVVARLDLLSDPEFDPQPGLTTKIKRLITGPAPVWEMTPEQDQIITLSILRGKLTVRRVGQSNVLNVFTTSENAAKAAAIANAVASSFIEQELEAKAEAARRGSAWLSNRLEEVREIANTAAIELADFKSRNELVDFGDGRFLNEQQLVQLNDQLMGARANMRGLESRLETLRSALDREAALANLPEMPNNPLVLNLRQQVTAQQGILRDLSARFGEDAISTRNARRELDALMIELRAEVSRAVESLNAEYSAAQLTEARLVNELNQLIVDQQDKRDARVEFQELESQSRAFREMYESLLQQYMRSVQLESFPVTDARIVSQASVPLSKSHPRTSLLILGGLTLGVLLGLGLGLLRFLFPQKVETPLQVSRRTRLPCVGEIPKRRIREFRSRQLIRLFDKRNANYTLAARELWSSVQSIARTSKQKDRNDPLVIGFSPVDNKVAMNGMTMDVARIIATQDKRVLFMSTRSIHELPGLDYDQEYDWLKDTLYHAATLRIAGGEVVLVAPAVPASVASTRSTESLATIVSLEGLLKKIEGEFDAVLIDLPLFGLAPEIRQLQQYLDGLFLLVRYRRTTIDKLADAADVSGPGHPVLSGYAILESKRRRRT